FQRGVLAWTPAGGVHAVTGPILEAWTSRDRQNGDLGHPTGDVRCQLRDGGCRQDFQRGTLAWSPATGARAVSGAIAQGWGWTGRESGPLGYPVEEMSCPAGGCLQTFQGGILAWTAAKGVHAVSGAIGELWTRLGRQTSPLGHPTSDMACTSTGCTQDFQGGTVTWTASLGARWLNGAIHQGWIWTGRETGTLGYPTGDMGCTGTGCTQDFQRGVLAWTPAGGVHAVTGPILEAWTSRDRQNGDLGHPTGDVRSTDSRDVQEFEGGTVTVNRTTGSVTVTPR
ncbi:LGFP repeat-containing protein, partial [Geodermatophilus sp. SYSU D01180]